jgi:hypothetical protein
MYKNGYWLGKGGKQRGARRRHKGGDHISLPRARADALNAAKTNSPSVQPRSE